MNKAAGFVWAFLAPAMYLAPLALPIGFALLWLDPWVDGQGWSGWLRIAFWFVYMSTSTALTLWASIMAWQWWDRR